MRRVPVVVAMVLAGSVTGIAQADISQGAVAARAVTTSGRIVFNSGCDLYAERADGTHRRLLTPSTPGCVSDPTVSPSGRRVAFTSGGAVYVSNAKRLADGKWTEVAGSRHEASSPEWSPDGTRIAYSDGTGSRGSPGPTAIFVLTVSTMTRVDATKSMPASNEYDPIWSPDGTTIAFTSDARGYGCSLDKTSIVDFDQVYDVALSTMAVTELTQNRSRAFSTSDWYRDRMALGVQRYPGVRAVQSACPASAPAAQVATMKTSTLKAVVRFDGSYPWLAPDGGGIVSVDQSGNLVRSAVSGASAVQIGPGRNPDWVRRLAFG